MPHHSKIADNLVNRTIRVPNTLPSGTRTIRTTGGKRGRLRLPHHYSGTVLLTTLSAHPLSSVRPRVQLSGERGSLRRPHHSKIADNLVNLTSRVHNTISSHHSKIADNLVNRTIRVHNTIPSGTRTIYPHNGMASADVFGCPITTLVPYF